MKSSPIKKLSRRQVWYLAAGAAAVLLLIFTLVTYNSLKDREEDVSRYWGRLQSAYQRRLDLLPRLVTVVKAGTDYEKQTLQKLAQLRGQAAQVQATPGVATGDNFKRLEEAQGAMVTTLNRLIAVIEDYPNLRGDTAFRRLQDQISGTENRIRIARNDFTDAVTGYNKKVRNFPASLVAGMLGFSKKEGFTAETGAGMAPQIKFNK